MEKDIFQKLDRLEGLILAGAKDALTLDEAAIFTGLSKSHLYKLTATKGIPHHKPSKHIYFDKKELENWMLQNRIKTTDEIEGEAATYLLTQKSVKA